MPVFICLAWAAGVATGFIAAIAGHCWLADNIADKEF